jgi:hypothetical protein
VGKLGVELFQSPQQNQTQLLFDFFPVGRAESGIRRQFPGFAANELCRELGDVLIRRPSIADSAL